MLMRPDWVETVQRQGRTVVDYFIAAVLKDEPMQLDGVRVSGVSDVDDARTIDLMPGGGHLTLFEREVSKGERETRPAPGGARVPDRGARAPTTSC